MGDSKRVYIDIPREKVNEAKIKALRMDKPLKEVIEGLVTQWIAESIPSKTVELPTSPETSKKKGGK